MITYDAVDKVATVTIDDAERRNPLSIQAMADLRDAIARSASDDAVSVVVVTGAGDSAFSAGGDLSGGFVDDPLGGHPGRGVLADVFRAIWRNPKPVVARVNGAALGGGFGLAVACDITIASEDAKLGTPEIGIGLWPMMISAVLVRAMPRKALLDMMLTGKVITAHEALEYGLVTTVVERDALDAAVEETVSALTERSSAAIALGKAAFYSMDGMDVDTALDHLHIGLSATAMTEDAAEGIEAFLTRRPPQWTDR